MKPYDAKQTKWEGLWYHPEYGGFSSAAFSLSDLREFKGPVRLYVKKNRFFNGGENSRPNYHFTIKDANSQTFHALEVEDENEEIYTDRDGNRLYTEEEVYTIIHGMENEYGLSYGNDLIEDYIY